MRTGLRFDCPWCAQNVTYDDEGAVAQAHRLAVYWNSPDARRNRWIVYGGDFAALSVEPSIRASEHPQCAGWHGLVSGGEVRELAG